jgi:hypothetical protein
MVKLGQGFRRKRWWSICICCLRCWPEGLVKEEDTLWLTYAPPLNSRIYSNKHSNKIHLSIRFPTSPSKTSHFSLPPVFHTTTKKLHSSCLQASWCSLCCALPWKNSNKSCLSLSRMASRMTTYSTPSSSACSVSIAQRNEAACVFERLKFKPIYWSFATIMCQGSTASNFTVNSDHLMGPVPKSLRNWKSVFRIHLDETNSLEIYSKCLGKSGPWRERNDRNFEDWERTLEDLKSFFLFSLYLDSYIFGD